MFQQQKWRLEEVYQHVGSSCLPQIHTGKVWQKSAQDYMEPSGTVQRPKELVYVSM